MEFEWDPNKEVSNINKHGISFIAAAELLLASHVVRKSNRQGEARYLAIGKFEKRVLAVVYTKRADKYRIISARRACKNEAQFYQKHTDSEL